MALTENQLRFCVEYAACRNGTKAYLKAFPGSSYNTARNRAAVLLQKIAIKKEIASARKVFSKDIATDARKTLDELAGLAHSDPDDVFDEGPNGEPVLKKWKSITPAGRKSIKKVKVRSRLLKGQGDEASKILETETEVHFHGRDSSLDKLAKYFGIINEGCAYWSWQEKYGEWVKAVNEAIAAGKDLPPPPPQDSRDVFLPKPGGFKTRPTPNQVQEHEQAQDHPAPAPEPTASPPEQTKPFCVKRYPWGKFEVFDDATGGLRFPTREAAEAERDRLNAEPITDQTPPAALETKTVKPAWPGNR